MAQNAVVVAEGRLTDWISIGVLASSVPRDVVDEVVAATGRRAKRSDGRLPPHVMVYFAMALALFAEEDYEEVAARLTETLASWGCWDDRWAVPTSGGITQARQRLGYEALKELFAQVAVPVAEELTRGAFVGPWRLMAIDGFEWDAPATDKNVAEFGYAGSDVDISAFPKIRVVTVSECASHAVVDAEMGGITGKGSGEQTLARRLYARLEPDWLLIADRNFYNWADWCTAATDHEWPGLILVLGGVSSPIMIDSWPTQGWMRYPDGGGLSEQGRAKREAVRLRAGEWFAQDMPVREVAHRLRVSANAVYVWRRRWRAGGPAALASKGPGGSSCRLDEQRQTRLAQALEQGPAAHGFGEDQRWTLARVADLIARLFHTRYTLRGVSYLLHRMGFSPQVPAHRAVERDEDAIVTWRKETWPAGKR